MTDGAVTGDRARGLRVAVELGRGRLRRAVVDYLATEPLLPRYRVRVGRPGAGPPDVRIVDWPAGAGLPAGRQSRAGDPRARGLVVVVDELSGADLLGLVAPLPPRSVVLASGPVREIGDGIDAVVRGGCWVSPSAAARLCARLPSGDGRADWPGAGRELTPTEHDVLALIVRGMSNKDIADRMHVATTTVRTHVRAILRKTDCGNRHQLTAAVMNTGGAAMSAARLQAW